MQDAICTLVSLGPLPKSIEADMEQLRRIEAALAKVRTPLSRAEAKALLPVFGPDDCFGLAWSLLHLVETAPDLAHVLADADQSNEWMERLLSRRN